MMTKDTCASLASMVAYTLAKGVTQLAETDLTTEEAGQLLNHVWSLYEFTKHLSADIESYPAGAVNLVKEPENEAVEPVNDAVVPANVVKLAEEPFHECEDSVPFETTEEAKTYTKAEVRGALGTARSAGLDVPGFLKEMFNTGSFSAVPEGKYSELMDELKKRGY